MWASDRGLEDVVSVLIDAGANLDLGQVWNNVNHLLNLQRENALIIAAKRESIEVLKKLLDGGADIEAKAKVTECFSVLRMNRGRMPFSQPHCSRDPLLWKCL